MAKFIIRNDDVGTDTNLAKLKKFCDICDKYGYEIIQAITPLGTCGKYARAHLTDDQIKSLSTKKLEENKVLVNYLRSRNDLIAVHGLWHTHTPSLEEIEKAKEILMGLGLNPTYFVPPFNEGDYPTEIAGLTTSILNMEKGERLEDFLDQGTPTAPIMYLHSWRFDRNYSFDQLDQCLKRLRPTIEKISDYPADPIRLWYNDWVSNNANGRVLDIGKSRHWDYGFPTLDVNQKLNPTYVGSIEKINFPDESFDTVLCNGMYEFVASPQAMINEVWRITKKGGTAIFGFIGADYPPYRQGWKYFSEKETLPPHSRTDFGQKYHFLICKKS